MIWVRIKVLSLVISGSFFASTTSEIVFNLSSTFSSFLPLNFSAYTSRPNIQETEVGELKVGVQTWLNNKMQSKRRRKQRMRIKGIEDGGTEEDENMFLGAYHISALPDTT